MIESIAPVSPSILIGAPLMLIVMVIGSLLRFCTQSIGRPYSLRVNLGTPPVAALIGLDCCPSSYVFTQMLYALFCDSTDIRLL